MRLGQDDTRFLRHREPGRRPGLGALASMIVRGNSPVFWLTVIESALLLFAFPALLVALTGKWRGRRFARAVTAFLVAGGCVNVLANAFGRVLGSERFLVVVFDALPVNGRDLPSIWLGLSLLAAAYAVRRAAREPGEAGS